MAESDAQRDARPTHWGSGWLSGVFSVALAAGGLFAVLCFHFPNYLTMPDLRPHYPVPYIRALLHLDLVAAFLLGVTSVVLRQNKALGLVGCGLMLVAALLGGSQVPIDDEFTNGPFLGLDWFLLNLILFSAIFIPLERLFARREDQPVLRRGWKTDLTYFFISTLAVQLTTLLTLKPAAVLFSWAMIPSLQTWVRSLPYVAQFFLLMFAVDIVQYWVHRVFHLVPWLWKFHAVHHSTDAMDWLAGSRLHVVEQVLTRGVTFVPIYLLGLGPEDPAAFAYIVFITFHSTFIHANVRLNLGPLNWWLTTPQFHHWHHAIEREAIDKNFAVHFPVLDLLFGTFYLPATWPTGYGIHDRVPVGWLRQLFYPFMPKPKPDTDAPPAVEVHS